MEVSNSKNIFITNYIMSLNERTRKETKGDKYGFDLIIYNLSISKGWTPQRLSFFREKDGLTCKTEAEFGVDQSFVLLDKKELVIFTLKDEKLNKSNWHNHNFLTDLEDACLPDLSTKDLASIKTVRVILAYNKDEDTSGEELFNRYKQNKEGKGKIANNADLIVEKWNLSRIVDEVNTHLLTPDLLPQHLSGILGYICSQIKDFKYGTNEWEKQLIPNWKNFLKVVLSKPIDEKKIRLIPVALSILYQNNRNTPDAYPAWIDLVEWAMLALWQCFIELKDSKTDIKIKQLIVIIWIDYYVAELEKYFIENHKALFIEHGLHSHSPLFNLTAINDAYLAYWHIGRLGILNLAPQSNFFSNFEKRDEILQEWVKRSSNWIINFLNLNPAAYRPLIDLHHIELFLIWLILWQTRNQKQIYFWLSELESRLLTRRLSNPSVPFIEGGNRLELVAEYSAMSEKPQEYLETSSHLLLMLLEFVCSITDDSKRNELFKRYICEIIKGQDLFGGKLAEDSIDLFSWVPPKDWDEKVMTESVWDGISISVHDLCKTLEAKGDIKDFLSNLVQQTREKYPFAFRQDIPHAVYVLACIKNKCPIPPEFWRSTIFPNNTVDEEKDEIND